MDQTTTIDLRRRRDIGGLVSATFDFIRINFRSLGRAVLYIAGPPIALVALLSGVLFVDMLDVSAYEYEPGSGDLGPLMGLVTKAATTTLLSYVVIAILMAVINSYMLIYLERKGEGEIEVSEVRARLFENIGLVISTLLMTTILTFIGFLLLMIPGIYLSITLSIILAVRMVERRGLFDAIRRCTDLMTGNWWATLGLMIVMTIIITALSWFISIPQFIISMLYGMTSVDGDISGDGYRLALIISTIVQTFGSNLIYSILIVATTINYFNLVERKEGTGSMARIEEIGAPADADSL